HVGRSRVVDTRHACFRQAGVLLVNDADSLASEFLEHVLRGPVGRTIVDDDDLARLLRANRLDRLRQCCAVVVTRNNDGDSRPGGVRRALHQAFRTCFTAAGRDRSRRSTGRLTAAEPTARRPRTPRARATVTSPGSSVASRYL